MQETFDGVPAVVEQEDDGLDTHAHHDRQFLHSQLTTECYELSDSLMRVDRYSHTAISDEEDHTTKSPIASGDSGAKGAADSPANAAPKNL